jgi:hypothetical protein
LGVAAVAVFMANPPIGHFQSFCRGMPLLRRSKVLPSAFTGEQKKSPARVGVSTAGQIGALTLGGKNKARPKIKHDQRGIAPPFKRPFILALGTGRRVAPFPTSLREQR